MKTKMYFGYTKKENLAEEAVKVLHNLEFHAHYVKLNHDVYQIQYVATGPLLMHWVTKLAFPIALALDEAKYA